MLSDHHQIPRHKTARRNAEIIVAAAYLLNHTPMEGPGWISPLEFLQKELGITKHVPRLAHLFVYGSRAYFYKKDMLKLDRLEPNGGIGYLCGYQSSNIYRVWIPAEKAIKPFRDVRFDEGKFYSPDDPDILAQIRQANEATEIPIATVIDPLNPGEEEERYRSSTDESDDELSYSNPVYREVNVIDQEPAQHAARDPLFELPTCPQDSEPDIQLPPTPRHTPEEEESAGQTAPASYSLHTTSSQPDPSESLPQPPQSSKRDNQTGKKDRAPRHEEISADVERPELIIPQRTRGQRREAYALAVARVGMNTGFHSAFAAGASQSPQRQHQSKLPPEPKNFKEMQAHVHSQRWLKATTDEFNKLLENGTA